MNHKSLFAVLFILCLVAAAPFAFTVSGSEPSREGAAARGEYLVTFGGCNDCHSPKVMTPMGPAPDPARLLSGHDSRRPLPEFDAAMVAPGQWALFDQDLTASVGPWGISYAANLTPDDQTGIGLWTEDIFIAAMRTGKHMGKGRPIQPPMPWFSVAALTDDDLAAVFAYLRSIPPVKNMVPANVAPNELENYR